MIFLWDSLCLSAVTLPRQRHYILDFSNCPLSRVLHVTLANRPRSIYQYSNMGPRLSGLTSIFGVVFFVSKSPLGIEGQKKL